MKNRGGIKTHFGDAAVPDPKIGGNWGGTKGGVDIGGGKSTGGVIPEVTMVDVEGAPKAGSQISGSTGGAIAGKDSKD